MTFYSGSKTLPELINLIADKLIASDPTRFTDITSLDPGYWTGLDTEPAWGTSCWYRRAVKWTDGSEVVYFAFEMPWWSSTESLFQIVSSQYQNSYVAGILVTMSMDRPTYNGWDFSTHSYNTTEIYHWHVLVPLYNNNGGWNNMNYNVGRFWLPEKSSRHVSELEYRKHLFWMWVDEESTPNIRGNGLCIMIRPSPGDVNGVTSFLNIERILNKEYSDDWSTWSAQTFWNGWSWSWSGTAYTLSQKYSLVIHPPGPHHTAYYGTPLDYWHIGNDTPKSMIKGIDFGYPGYRSDGNNKVYYTKPIIHSDASQNKHPMYQLEHFFKVYQAQGLFDGDVILTEGGTTKYLTLMKTSPWSSNVMPIAVKYVA